MTLCMAYPIKTKRLAPNEASQPHPTSFKVGAGVQEAGLAGGNYNYNIPQKQKITTQYFVFPKNYSSGTYHQLLLLCTTPHCHPGVL